MENLSAPFNNIPPISKVPVGRGRHLINILLTVLVLSILITASYILYGYFFTNGKKTESAPTPTIASIQPTIKIPDPTEGWKTHQNDKYNFSLKYPGNEFKVSTESAKYVAEFIYTRTVKGISTKNPITITKLNIPTSQAFEDVLLKNVTYEASGNKPESFSEFTKVSFGDNEFYYIQIGRFEGQLELSYFLPQEEYILGFNLSSYIGADWTNPEFDVDNEKYHLILKQMLSTLTIKEETLSNSKWKIYTNTLYHYSFKYPENWFVNGNENSFEYNISDREIIEDTLENRSISNLIEVGGPKSPLQEFGVTENDPVGTKKILEQNDKLYEVKISDLKFGDKKAVKLKLYVLPDSDTNAYPFIEVRIDKALNNYGILSFSIYYDDNNPNKELEEIFDQILSTLEFTK